MTGIEYLVTILFNSIYCPYLLIFQGVDCLSEYPIVFHYISQETMFLLDFLVYTANFSRFDKHLHGRSVDLKFNGTVL